jgi:hypothetical protein
VTDTIEDILSDGYLGDLESLDIADLRSRRSACKDVETGLSYLRRLVQGRLDVVSAERARREDGGSGEDLDDLIARLPELLAGSTRAPGTGRLPESFGTGEVDPGLSDELDRIMSSSHLSEPDSLSDSELAGASDALSEFEAKVSALRRQLFDRIDALEAELTRRYRTGEASVDTLLS